MEKKRIKINESERKNDNKIKFMLIKYLKNYNKLFQIKKAKSNNLYFQN